MAAAARWKQLADAGPTIPCELCNMMVSVSKFGDHLWTRHGVGYKGEEGTRTAGQGDGGGGDGAAGPTAVVGTGFGTQLTETWNLPLALLSNIDCAMICVPEVAMPAGLTNSFGTARTNPPRGNTLRGTGRKGRRPVLKR